MPSLLPFSLACPAQGSPVPSYRLVIFIVLEPVGGSTPKRSSLSEPIMTPSLGHITAMVCPVQGSPLPAFRHDKEFNSNFFSEKILW